MGVSVREKRKGSGIWYVEIYHEGRRKARRIGAKTEAEKVKAILDAKMSLGEFTLNDTEPEYQMPTFKQVSDEWVATHVNRLSPATQQRYKHLLKKHINPYLGKLPIDEIKRYTVLRHIERLLAKGQSIKSVQLVKDVISGVMERGIDLEYINFNPTSKVMGKILRTNQNAEKDVEVFTADEVEQILLTCKKLYPGYYPLFLCAFRTGMRIGELLGLEWQDINWNDDYIRVQRSYKNQRISPTKNKQNRSVDMSPQLKAEFKRLRTLEKQSALKEGRAVEQPIFKHRGNRFAQNSVRNIWKRLLDKSGYDHRKFHTTRHTFASLLLSSNTPLTAVKEQMGHHSIKITVDTYGKFIKSGEGITGKLDSAPMYAPEKEKVSNQL